MHDSAESTLKNLISDEEQQNRLQISRSNYFPQSQLLTLTMNIQSWNFSGSPLQEKTFNYQFTVSQFAQNFFSQPEKIEKQKSITIANYFQCNEEVKFVVTIAKFATIFNIPIESMECLKTLSQKEKSYIRDYNFESVLADTNRKLFTKSFQKSTHPQLSLTATFGNYSGLVLIIQHSKNQTQKVNIKIINCQNLIHTIINNIKVAENFDQLGKLLDSKLKKTQTVVCFDNAYKKCVNMELFSFLLSRYNQVFYIAASEEQHMPFANQKEENYKYQNKFVKLLMKENFAILTTNLIERDTKQKIISFYQKYKKINNMINQQISKQKISKSVFKQNELCISFYGIYYNFISLKNIQNTDNIQTVQQQFLSKFIEQKNQILKKVIKQNKKPLNRKLGHYPVKITNGKKVTSKVCCVCQDNKRKSRYKCEKCSDTYSRDIAICLDHFKEYHDNIHKYIPKGVRKGAYKNEIMQFMERKEQQIQQKNVEQSFSNSSKMAEEPKPTKDLQNILSKWDSKLQNGLLSLRTVSVTYFQCYESQNFQIMPPLPQSRPPTIQLPIVEQQCEVPVKKEQNDLI